MEWPRASLVEVEDYLHALRALPGVNMPRFVERKYPIEEAKT